MQIIIKNVVKQMGHFRQGWSRYRHSLKVRHPDPYHQAPVLRSEPARLFKTGP